MMGGRVECPTCVPLIELDMEMALLGRNRWVLNRCKSDEVLIFLFHVIVIYIDVFCIECLFVDLFVLF